MTCLLLDPSVLELSKTKFNFKIALKCITLSILSFLNHETRCNVCLDNSHCPQQVFTGINPMQSSLKMMASGFEDHLMLWSIEIWLVTSGRNGLKLQLYCWWQCSTCCYLNTGVYFFQNTCYSTQHTIQ